MSKSKLKEKQYSVAGMHCASCELLIENKLLERKNIKSVEVSESDESVLIEFTGKAPTTNKLNRMFADDGYQFSSQEKSQNQISSAASFNSDEKNNAEPLFKISSEGDIIWNWKKIKNLLPAIIIVGLIFSAFLKFGSSSLARFSVNNNSSLITFFGFGVVAGLSTCSALVGGIVLSMSKQWASLYNTTDSTFKKLEPHLLFNGGRIFAYGLMGILLGAIGNVFQISLEFSALLTLGVSLVMLLLALQMLGIKWAKKIQFKVPKRFTRTIANEKKFTGKQMPILMGAGTIFLPCGFTITAQSLALLSGDPLRGALLMLAFVLGTTPILFMIGLSSLMFNKKPHIAKTFSQIAGFLIILFAFYNMNAGLNVLGITNFSDIFGGNKSQNTQLVTNKNNKQIIKMSASGSEYTPNYFKVKAGIPVEWQITDNGASGCTNAVIAKDLFEGKIPLKAGTTVSKTFTATKPGKYKFSCWMGMASGIIEVIK